MGLWTDICIAKSKIGRDRLGTVYVVMVTNGH